MVLGMGRNNHHATPTVAGSRLSLQHHHLSFSLEPEAFLAHGLWGQGRGGCGKGEQPAGPLFMQVSLGPF